MRDLVSIVIPMYNCEKTIYRCLRSVCNQTYKNLEIITVDDGSTDNTYSVISKLQKKDKRIRYYKQENQGPSKARNTGIEIAKGKYLAFVDADDRVCVSMIEELINIIKKEKVELVIGNLAEIIKKGNKLKKIAKEFPETKIQSKIMLKETFFDLLKAGCLNTPCCKLYDLCLIKKNDIKMDLDLDMGEDLQFNLSYLKNTSKIYITSKTLYFYYKNNSFLTNKFRDNMFDKRKKSIELFYCFLKEEEIDTSIIDYLYLKLFFSCVMQDYDFRNEISKCVRRNRIEQMLKKTEIRMVLKNPSKMSVPGIIMKKVVMSENIFIIEKFSILLIFVKKIAGYSISRISI